jgi:hypothetical protein
MELRVAHRAILGTVTALAALGAGKRGDVTEARRAVVVLRAAAEATLVTDTAFAEPALEVVAAGHIFGTEKLPADGVEARAVFRRIAGRGWQARVDDDVGVWLRDGSRTRDEQGHCADDQKNSHGARSIAQPDVQPPTQKRLG